MATNKGASHHYGKTDTCACCQYALDVQSNLSSSLAVFRCDSKTDKQTNKQD